MDAGLVVKPSLVGEHLIPDVAAAAEGLFEKLRLFCCGVKPHFDGGVLELFVPTACLLH